MELLQLIYDKMESYNELTSFWSPITKIYSEKSKASCVFSSIIFLSTKPPPSCTKLIFHKK